MTGGTGKAPHALMSDSVPPEGIMSASSHSHSGSLVGARLHQATSLKEHAAFSSAQPHLAKLCKTSSSASPLTAVQAYMTQSLHGAGTGSPTPGTGTGHQTGIGGSATGGTSTGPELRGPGRPLAGALFPRRLAGEGPRLSALQMSDWQRRLRLPAARAPLGQYMAG